jgi:hypothetical protein
MQLPALAGKSVIPKARFQSPNPLPPKGREQPRRNLRCKTKYKPAKGGKGHSPIVPLQLKKLDG